MAISRIGAATAAGSSLTPSWSGAGAREIEIAWAYRSGSATPPTVPTGSGWKTIKTEGANTNSGALAYRFAPTNSNVASGTFTNATQLIITRYAGVKGIGNVASSAVSSNSISYPALTMVQTAGNSWIFGAGGHRTATNVNTAPSGMTNITSVGNICAVHDTNAGVSSWAGASASVNASSGHESMTIELLADGGAWSLYDAGNGASAWSVNTENKVVNRVASVSHAGIRQFTGRSTGKWAIGFRHLLFGDTSDLTIGFVPITQSLTAWPDDGVTFVFDSDALTGGPQNQVYVDAGGGATTTFASGTAVDEFVYGSLAIDLDAGEFYVCHQNMPDWNGNPLAHPNSGIGGIPYNTGKGSVLYLWHSTGNQGSSFAINTFTLNDAAPTWTFPANASDFQPWDNPATGRTATAALAVGTVVSAGAAAAAIAATAPLAVGAASVSSAATLAIFASAPISVGTVTAASAAIAAIEAAAALAVGAVTVSAEASSAEDRDAAANLLVGSVTADADATAAISATAPLTIGGVTAAAVATSAIDGAVALTPSVTVASHAAAAIDATGALAPGVSVSAAAAAAIEVAAALAAGAVTVAATGGSEDVRFASGNLQAGIVSAAGQATAAIDGAAGLDVGAVAVAAQAGLAGSVSGALTIGGATVTAGAEAAIEAQAVLQVGAVLVAGQIGSPVAVISPECMVTPRPRRRVITPAGRVRMINPAPRRRIITVG